jgi:hypothetical protein
LAQAILTALPGSVLANLANPNSRSSLASAFKAGQTPQWYINLAPDIKSYVESVETHATTGCTPTATPTADNFATGETSDGASGTGGSGSHGVTSTSSKALAARPTAAVARSISGAAMGIIGLLLL